MLPLIFLNSINVLTTSIIGLMANSVLLWLILRRTKEEMKIYSVILLQSCITDLALLLVQAVAQPIIFVDQTIISALLTGPLRVLPNPWNRGVCYLWAYLVSINYWQLGIQFYYRFIMVTKNVQLSNRLYFTVLFLLPIFGNFCMLLPTFFPNNDADASQCCKNREIPKLLGLHEEDLSSITFAVRNDTSLGQIMLSVGPLLGVLNYTLITICSWKTWKFIKKNLKEVRGDNAERKRETNRQISRILTLQALFPFLMLLSDASISLMFVNNGSLYITIVGFFPAHWFQAVSPIITILAVRSYREAIFCCGKFDRQEVTPNNRQQFENPLQTTVVFVGESRQCNDNLYLQVLNKQNPRFNNISQTNLKSF